jgi:cytochrome c oxidase assembly factor CtaG
MTLLAIAEGSESHAYGWCESAAQSSWPGAWAILAGLLMGGVYYSSILAFGQREKRPRMDYFTLGLMVWVATLSGPLERLALSRLYSAYILQQIILVMIVCPALLLGLEGWMLRPLTAKPWIFHLLRAITRPRAAFAVFVCVFTLIHVPWVCNQLCHVKPFYQTVRLSLFVAGLILWCSSRGSFSGGPC